MPISEFQDLLQRLSLREFQRFVVEALRSSGRFADVSLTSQTRDHGTDIVAIEKAPPDTTPAKWLFEVKQHRLVSVDVARYVAALPATRGWPAEPVHVVLVIAGSVTPEAEEVLRHSGIEIWGPMRLADIASPDTMRNFFPEQSPLAPQAADEQSDAKSRADRFAASLKTLAPGNDSWIQYQRLVADVLEFLFCPPLDPPRYEFMDKDKRNRRDIIFENSAHSGYWAQLRATYHADYVVVDAKNYAFPLKKVSVLEIAHYLKPYGCGMLALLVSRKGVGEAGAHAIREQWIGAQKMIVSVSDDKLLEMLAIKADGGAAEEIIRRSVADFRMTL